MGINPNAIVTSVKEETLFGRTFRTLFGYRPLTEREAWEAELDSYAPNGVRLPRPSFIHSLSVE